MINRYIVAAVLCFVLSISSVFAGITGIVTGKVVDKENKPLGGVTIRVLGTNRGGFTKNDGSYVITNVNAGTYNVRATVVGYDTVTREAVIYADQTVKLDFVLTEGGITTKVVDVSASRDMIRPTDLGSNRTVKGADLTRIARDNIASAISLQAGITASGNNFIIRGSRTTETQVLVDGLTVTDQFTGGLGQSGSTVSAAMPSPYATEEVQAQTGGFGAEYGNAVGGIVNTVVKTGRTDRYDGVVRWRKDVPFLWGNAGNGVEAGYPSEDVVDATLGGPLGITNSTFFVSVRNTFQLYRNYGLQVSDPANYNLGMLPNNRTWSRNITGRLKFTVTSDVTLLLGGLYGLVNGERSSQTWLYASQEGYIVDANGIPILDNNGNYQYNGFTERSAKQIVVQEFSSNAFAQINHQLGENTFYELRASFNTKVTETGKRVSNAAPGLFSGWTLYYPVDQIRFEGASYAKGANQVLDAYEYLRATQLSADGYQRLDATRPNPITGFIEGPADYQTTANPYGLLGYFAKYGNEGGIDFRKATYWQADGSITHTTLAGDTRHIIKGGFELRLLTLARHTNGNPWDGNPFYDVYGSEYGGNLYYVVDTTNVKKSQEVLAQSLQPFQPITGAVYFQDQIIFKRLVFTPGFRLDYLDPRSLYRTRPEYFVGINSDTGFAQASKKLYFSPRLSITYPVSDDGRQNFNLSYGVYYQVSPFSNYFDSFNVINLRPGSILGDPNLALQSTNQYQVSYNHQLSDNFALTVTGYYKDIYNQPDIAYVRSVPISYYLQTVSAYGNSRGIEFTFIKRTADNWGFNVNYSLASATGTASNSTTVVAEDPQTGRPAFPVEPFPLSFDRRHRVNGSISFQWNTDEGPRIGGIPFLENFNINISGVWQTGVPYTPVNGQSQAIGAYNSGRYPATWNTELRVIRTIPLAGFLGGQTALDLILDVSNLLNYTGAISFYTTTGDPDYDGRALNRPIGTFPSTLYYRDADPKNKATTDAQQYDRVGNRLYNNIVDYNSDGVVTQEETYQGYQRYVQDVVNRRGNYQYPRQVFFALAFRF